MELGILGRLSRSERAELAAEIREEAIPRPSFYVLVLLSTAIASYGLLANSTAVVIGAMLIAPLMGPIYGIALGVIRDDRRLLLMSLASEAIGILLAVGLAAMIGALPLRPEFGTEIIARTRPNLYDLLVAIVAGVAGGYARTSARVSPTLPGVAIATALVPPLAVSGLCIADARWEAAGGAFLLFVTNLLAIEIAAAIVFLLAGLGGRAADAEPITHVRRFAIPVLLLLPISAFLLQTLITIVRDDRLTRSLRTTLDAELQEVVGAEVTEIRHQRSDDELRVTAVVLTPQSIEPAQVSAAEAELQRSVDPAARLIVRSLISRDADRAGHVFLDPRTRERLRTDRERESLLRTVSVALRQELAGLPGTELVDVQREQRDSPRIRATVRTPETVGPEQVERMQRAAAAATGAPIELVVRSIPTREADARAFLDEDQPAARRQRASRAVAQLLERHLPSAELLAVRVVADDELQVTATLVDAGALDRPLLERLNAELTEAMGVPTRLALRAVASTRLIAEGGR